MGLSEKAATLKITWYRIWNNEVYYNNTTPICDNLTRVEIFGVSNDTSDIITEQCFNE